MHPLSAGLSTGPIRVMQISFKIYSKNALYTMGLLIGMKIFAKANYLYNQKIATDEPTFILLMLGTPKCGVDRSNVISLDNYRWKNHCRGLYQLPLAAEITNLDAHANT